MTTGVRQQGTSRLLRSLKCMLISVRCLFKSVRCLWACKSRSLQSTPPLRIYVGGNQCVPIFRGYGPLLYPGHKVCFVKVFCVQFFWFLDKTAFFPGSFYAQLGVQLGDPPIPLWGGTGTPVPLLWGSFGVLRRPPLPGSLELGALLYLVPWEGTG